LTFIGKVLDDLSPLDDQSTSNPVLGIDLPVLGLKAETPLLIGDGKPGGGGGKLR